MVSLVIHLARRSQNQCPAAIREAGTLKKYSVFAIAREAMRPYEEPAGVVTALIGAPIPAVRSATMLLTLAIATVAQASCAMLALLRTTEPIASV